MTAAEKSLEAIQEGSNDGRAAWYAVGVLLVAYTLSFVDRTILALLVGPIKEEMQLTDVQVSLLLGFAFALFYTLMGIPIARLADQFSRRKIIAIGVCFWSLMTALCGVTKTFWQLFAARVGVGVGEAALSPAAYSMIADYFPPNKLARALGIYSAGVYVGAGLAFIIGGYIVQLLTSLPPITIPVFGELAAWQATFIAVGLPGVLVSLLVLTIKEPKRKSVREKAADGTSQAAKASIGATFRFVGRKWQTFAAHFAGFSFLALVFNAIVAWGPTMLIRKFGWSISESGYLLGGTLLVFGTAGIISGGLLADWLMKKGRKDGTLISGIVSAIGVIPTALLATLSPSELIAAIAFAPLMFFASFSYGAAAAALQLVAPNHMRAQVSAFYLFVLNVVGLGLGPTLVAAITDYILLDEAAVDVSIAIVTFVAAIGGGISLWLGLRHFREAIDSLKETYG